MAFFNGQVANQSPDLLIDVCDYWLSQMQFKVPSNYSEQAKTQSYDENLKLILIYVLQRNRRLFLRDIQSFKRWIDFINYLHLGKAASPEEPTEAERIVQAHVKEVLKLSDIRPLALVKEIVQEWVSKRVLEGGRAKFKRQHSIGQRQHSFTLIQEQLLNLACPPTQLSMGTFNEMVKALFRPVGSSSAQDGRSLM